MSKCLFNKIKWTSVRPTVDGWIARLSVTVPVVGWLILFNDSAGGALKFESLGISMSEGLFHANTRLRLVYFGLISLGAANFIFRVSAPKEILRYENSDVYVRTAMELYTHEQLVQISDRISNDNIPTDEGGDQTWDIYNFQKSAERAFETLSHDNRSGKLEYEDVKLRYAPYLRRSLRCNYMTIDGSKKILATCSLVFAYVGYGMLLLPSFDVFLQVVYSSF